MAQKHSIVEYLGEQRDSKCGYCKSESSYHSFGMWGHMVNTEDYQRLINRSWRRSGHYLYRPNNVETCCPMYTIKSDVIEFQLKKSHKKIIKKMNKFLKDGIQDKPLMGDNSSEKTNETTEIVPGKCKSQIDIESLCTLPSSRSLTGEKSDCIEPEIDLQKDNNKFETDTVDVVNTQKPNCKKAKLMRIERTKNKLALKGETFKPKKVKSFEKSLEDFLSEEKSDGVYKLKVRIVPSSEGFTEDCLNLYSKYQTIIHNEPPEKNTKKTFERFLINSPLQIELVSVDDDAMKLTLGQSFKLFEKYERNIHKSTENVLKDFKEFLVESPLKQMKNKTSPPQGYGSFHQQYYLNDKLIAVGVIDILPSCISSVYFFYDPDYNFLSLGTYASLREIALTRELMKSCPSLKSYYLGYYIPTCPKMRYKGKITPSYLLCPEAYTFHILDEKLSNAIDSVKYKKINEGGQDSDCLEKDDLKNVLVLANRTALKYGDYRLMAQSTSQQDKDEVAQYANKVGKILSQSMLLYRN